MKLMRVLMVGLTVMHGGAEKFRHISLLIDKS